jgi:hypothetical protein
MLHLEISSRSHSLENSVWKRLWTCHETDKYLTLESCWSVHVSQSHFMYVQFNIWWLLSQKQQTDEANVHKIRSYYWMKVFYIYF